jgi:DNA-binding NarL/FixJ family response regulator
VSRTFRPPISVFLAHPDAGVRHALGDEIAGTGISVVGESGNGREALARILDQAPDVALLSVDLPDLDTVEVCEQLRAELPVCRVLLLADEAAADATEGSDEDDAYAGFLAGAFGCFVIGAPQVSLVKAIRGTMRRESLPTAAWATRILAQYAELAKDDADRLVPSPKLTSVETDVLTRLAAGDTPQVIADAQEITTHMVRIHAGYAAIKLSRALADEQLMASVR